MYPPRTSHVLLALITALSPSVVGFECNNIVAKGQEFNFEKLGGPHVVHWTQAIPTADLELRHNFTLDICNKLQRDKGVEKQNWCHDGVRGRQFLLATQVDV